MQRLDILNKKNFIIRTVIYNIEQRRHDTHMTVNFYFLTLLSLINVSIFLQLRLRLTAVSVNLKSVCHSKSL